MSKYFYTPTLALMNIYAKRAEDSKSEADVASAVSMGIHVFRAVMAGELPVPLELVLPYASSMSIDRGLLFAMWLRDYAGAIDRVMTEIVGDFFVEGARELLAKADVLVRASDPPNLNAIIPVIEWFIDYPKKFS